SPAIPPERAMNPPAAESRERPSRPGPNGALQLENARPQLREYETLPPYGREGPPPPRRNGELRPPPPGLEGFPPPFDPRRPPREAEGPPGGEPPHREGFGQRHPLLQRPAPQRP